MRTNELHATAKQVGRSSGRSSVAAAAYRSGEIIVDERTGIVHDYTKKGGIEYTRIYLPDNAPDHLNDRAALWNAVEFKENRKNSTTAHELEIAFPHEFNAMQRREAGDMISKEIMRRYNCAVDIAYHQPNREGDQRNFHAHILFTTRGFDEGSSDGWSKNKFRDLSSDKITVDGEATTRGKEEVKSLRAFTASEMNRISERDKLDVKTEHLSFEARGIDKEPTQKMGYMATQLERRGVKTERGDLNRAIKASNDNITLEGIKGNTTMQLKDQKQQLLLEQKRALLALELEREGEDGKASGTWQATLASFGEKKSFPFHQKRVEQAQDDLAKAKEQLASMSLMDRMIGKKAAYEAEIQVKEQNLKEAQDSLKEIKSDKKALAAQLEEIENARAVTAVRTAQYKQEQGEAVALQAKLENRTNTQKIIGAITGKAKEQNARLEELQASINSYEADKRLEEIKQQQIDRARHAEEEKQREQTRSNDNRQDIEARKQQYLKDAAKEREEKSKTQTQKQTREDTSGENFPENDKLLSVEERKQAYLDRMQEQREKEAAQKEQEQQEEKPSYENLPENDTSLSKEKRKEAYIDRAQQEREQNPDDGKDRDR